MSKHPTEKIVYLYTVEELNVRQIADRLGLAYGQVYGVLRKQVVMRKPNYSIPRRTVSHLDVAEAIRQRIVAGNWKPGSKITPQIKLARQFRVNHEVISQAARHLQACGYLIISNKGTFVRSKQDWNQMEEKQ